MSEEVEWSVTKQILGEVEQLFNRDDDLRDIQNIKRMQNQIDLETTTALKDARDIIKELTNRVAAKEAEIIAPSDSSHAAGLEKIMLEKENIASQIELLRGVLDKKKDHILKLATSSLSLREKTSELTSSTQSPDPRTMYELSLYKKVSGIQWDYSAPAGRLAGHISNDGTEQLRAFNIDTRALTPFETANRLWEKIAETYN